MHELPMTLAVCDYDHVRDLVAGKVRAEGLNINFQSFSVQEIFHRFTTHREWDASEMSMGMYVSLRSQGDDSLTAIPVFTSRMFRHSSFYVRADSGLNFDKSIDAALDTLADHFDQHLDIAALLQIAASRQ